MEKKKLHAKHINNGQTVMRVRRKKHLEAWKRRKYGLTVIRAEPKKTSAEPRKEEVTRRVQKRQAGDDACGA